MLRGADPGGPWALLGGIKEPSIWYHRQPLADADTEFRLRERVRVCSKASKGSILPIRKNPFKGRKIEDEELKIA